MLHQRLQSNPTKCENAVAFTKRIFDAGHAELTPQVENEDSEEIWYLPIFSISHSKILLLNMKDYHWTISSLQDLT